MSKNTIKDNMEKLLSLCSDRAAATTLINEIIDKTKRGKTATELSIPTAGVIKRYKVTEAIEIVRCKKMIYLHSNSFWVVSKPTLANNAKGGALYEMLTWYCDYMDSRESYGPEEQKVNDTMCTMIVSDLMLPLDIFTDMNFCVDISQYIMTKRAEFYEALANAPYVEKDEEDEANLEFIRQGLEMDDELKNLAENDTVKG